MIALLATGHVFDVVLGVIVLEFLVLGGYRLVRGAHLVAVDVYPNLMAAAGLVAATHAVLAGAWWGITGALLAAALLSHLQALRLRWRRTLAPWPRGRHSHDGALFQLRVSRR